MKINIVIFWILTAYFATLATVYAVWNIITYNTIETAGFIALLLSGGLSGMIAFYLGLVKKNQGGELHEDIETADIDEGDPEIGHFAPWSWWPIILAFGGCLFFMGFGLNQNFFLVFFAVPVLVLGVVGWVYEHYRGLHAR